MTKPEFISFTGVDDFTTPSDFSEMLQLASRYPIEWAILYSSKSRGSARYPGWRVFNHLVPERHHASIAVHLCGSVARNFIKGEVEPGVGFMLSSASRVQVNVSQDELNAVGTDKAVKLAQELGPRLILQCRDGFPLIIGGALLVAGMFGAVALMIAWPVLSVLMIIGELWERHLAAKAK